jgi:nucleolar protein 58
MTLAKKPASTVQILGAEKALFRALKTKHDTPKYGLIFHASLIGQATGKNKGKIARMLATKATLGLRVDALSDWGQAGAGQEEEPTEEEKAAVGVAGRNMVERRLRALEGKPLKMSNISIGPQGQKQQQPGKWDLKEARKYNADADGLSADAAPAAAPVTNGTDSSKKKRKLIEEVAAANDDDEDDSDDSDDDEETVAPSSAKSTSKSEDKIAKAAEKAAKAARKAEKAAKKAAKAEKKAAKEAKKKRKADDADDSSKKKQKKSKA